MASKMTQVGFQYAIGALSKKRAELAGEIASLFQRLRHARKDMAKVDDILRILSPAANPAAIPPKKAIRYLNVFRQGELGRLIIAILREEKRAMTNLEIARVIMERGGYDYGLWGAMRRRCRANLAYLHEQGRVIKTGFAKTARWAAREK